MPKLERILKSATIRAAKRDYKKFKKIRAHEFSPAFHWKMQELIKQAKGGKKRMRKIKVFLIVAAIILLNVTVILANETFREKISQILKISTKDNNLAPEATPPKAKEVGETLPSFLTVYQAADSYDAAIATIEASMQEMPARKEQLFLRTASDNPPRAVTEDLGIAAEEASPWSDMSWFRSQARGIEGGDIMKVDGEYFYTVSAKSRDFGSTVVISKLEGNNRQEIAVITAGSQDDQEWGESFKEVYISDGKLYIIATSNENADVLDIEKNKEKDEEVYVRAITSVYTYDVANPKEPKLMGKVSHSGDYDSMRIVGDYLYFFSSYRIDKEGFKSQSRNEENAFAKAVPLSNEKLVVPEDIYLPVNANGEGYVVVSAMNVNEPNIITDTKAIMGHSLRVYATQTNIYMQLPNWHKESPDTNVVKFGFYDGEIVGESAASVNGLITCGEAINEYDDTIRVLSTEWGETNVNYVTVLDDKMNVIGEGLGVITGETIAKVRFINNIGYFTTYERDNPIYAIDLSNPHEPKEVGRVEGVIFPEYMVAYGQDRVFGLAKRHDADTEDYLESYIYMLDVSDPINIKAVSSISIDEELAKRGLHQYAGGISFASENDERAIMVDQENGVIGLDIRIAPSGPASYHDYMILNYEANKDGDNLLVKEIITFPELSMSEEEYAQWQARWQAIGERAIYIRGNLYIVNPDGVYVFDEEGDFNVVFSD